MRGVATSSQGPRWIRLGEDLLRMGSPPSRPGCSPLEAQGWAVKFARSTAVDPNSIISVAALLHAPWPAGTSAGEDDRIQRKEGRRHGIRHRSSGSAIMNLI